MNTIEPYEIHDENYNIRVKSLKLDSKNFSPAIGRPFCALSIQNVTKRSRSKFNNLLIGRYLYLLF